MSGGSGLASKAGQDKDTGGKCHAQGQISVLCLPSAALSGQTTALQFKAASTFVKFGGSSDHSSSMQS